MRYILLVNISWSSIFFTFIIQGFSVQLRLFSFSIWLKLEFVLTYLHDGVSFIDKLNFDSVQLCASAYYRPRNQKKRMREIKKLI